MSAREWKAGDVARVELYNGVVHEIALKLPLHDGGWTTGAAKYVHSVHLKEARPLLVIDPEDVAQVDGLLSRYMGEHPPSAIGNMQAALRTMLEPPAPPKPDEPTGLGAVVSCTYDGDRTGKAVKWSEASDEWTFYGSGLVDHSAMYDDFDNVTILSPGITPDEPEAEEAVPPDLTAPGVAFTWRDGAYHSLRLGMEESPWSRHRIRDTFTGELVELPHGTAVRP